MIKTEYITFQSAKLLKEAGYPQDIDEYLFSYNPDGEAVLMQYADWSNDIVCPTLAQAMRWLREDKGVHVGVIFNACDDWQFCLAPMSGEKYEYFLMERYHSPSLPTYEEALDAGIQSACAYIIEKFNNKEEQE